MVDPTVTCITPILAYAANRTNHWLRINATRSTVSKRWPVSKLPLAPSWRWRDANLELRSSTESLAYQTMPDTAAHFESSALLLKHPRAPWHPLHYQYA